MSLHERGPQESRSLDLKREPQFLHIGTEFDFGGIKERIITRENLPLEDARKILKGRVFGVLGYGVQGPAQAMNLRDNGLPVIIWQRKEYSKPGKPKTSWERAVDDGWKEGETLFPDPDLKVVMQKANFIQYLLSDAGQAQRWPEIRALLKQGDVLQFSHGFAPVFHKLTEVVVPEFVDLTLIAPKGPGRGVREHFEHGRGVNSSVAVAQDASGKALLLTLASGMAIGSGFLFPTSFEKEVFSDLTGERGILMGAFKGLMDASYN
ncbi:MAG: hypothetical protein HY424_01310, partial [Candidatus Levybacteria bacterium]|nr:hypothetical protein [Candidatus Levybacteria bacterium]